MGTFIEILKSDIQKFNPYHDKHGRFTFADGAASFTYSPGKSKAHDNAIAREKERTAAASGGSDGGASSIANSNKIKQEFLDDGLNSKFPGIRAKAQSGTGNYAYKDNVAVSADEALEMQSMKFIERNGKTLVHGVIGNKGVFYANNSDSKGIKALREEADRRAQQRKEIAEHRPDPDKIQTTSTYERWYNNNKRKFLGFHFGSDEKMGKSLTFSDIVKSEIEKFNPYHDRLGRFTFGSGFGMSSSQYTGDKSRQAVTFSANPETTAGANAIARHGGVVPTAYGWKNGQPPEQPKQPDKPKEPEKPKEKTIAGVEKGEPMTHEQANQERPNPHFKDGSEFRVNCQTCVVAYEARLRGYDVQAKGKVTQTQSDLARATNKAWIDPKTGKNPEYIENPNLKTYKQAVKWMDQTINEGERYTVQHGWKSSQFSGHIITATKENGSLKLYDPQSGKTYVGNEVNDYMSRTKINVSIMGMKIPRLKLLKVDDYDFDYDVVNEILTKAGD